VARVLPVVPTMATVAILAILAVAAARHVRGVAAAGPRLGPDTGICLDIKIHEVERLGEEAGRYFA